MPNTDPIAHEYSCEFCGELIAPGECYIGLVRGPSTSTEDKPAPDGRHLTFACSGEHLDRLIRQARADVPDLPEAVVTHARTNSRA